MLTSEGKAIRLLEGNLHDDDVSFLLVPLFPGRLPVSAAIA